MRNPNIEELKLCWTCLSINAGCNLLNLRLWDGFSDVNSVEKNIFRFSAEQFYCVQYNTIETFLHEIIF